MPTAKARAASEVRLVNGSTGDPVLFIDYPGRDDAILFDAGENGHLAPRQLADLGALFITHHHVDHFVGLDRIVRANLDRDKTLHIFGPIGTIRKVYDRVTSYEHPYFPFQKLVLDVRDVKINHVTRARLECARHFPEPEPVDEPLDGPTLFRADGLRVEFAEADHTVPCLAYALVEESGYHPDAAKLADGAIRPGPWVAEVLARLRAGEPLDAVATVAGGRFTLGDLADRAFHRSPEVRVAYITDTADSATVRPGLVKLAYRAWRLYCDSFYAEKDAKQAEKYHHLTATRAAHLAKAAKVDALVLMHFANRYEGKYAALVEEAKAIFPATTAEIG